MIKRQFTTTKIISHKNKKLKTVYQDIYQMLKTIRSTDSFIKPQFYIQLVETNPIYPEWLKRQMKKLIKRRIKLIQQSAPKKWVDFRLIVPRCRSSWAGTWYIPDDSYLKHLYFDSRNVFITTARKGCNGAVRKVKLDEYEELVSKRSKPE
jgi:hypothetical protein